MSITYLARTTIPKTGILQKWEWTIGQLGSTNVTTLPYNAVVNQISTSTASSTIQPRASFSLTVTITYYRSFHNIAKFHKIWSQLHIDVSLRCSSSEQIFSSITLWVLLWFSWAVLILTLAIPGDWNDWIDWFDINIDLKLRLTY
jgi:hypothetical protein